MTKTSLKTLAIAACALILSSAPFLSAQAAEAEGYWLTQNKRAVVQTYMCDTQLCGKIYWIIDGGMQVDEKNPDPALQSRPLCKLEILQGFDQNNNNAKVWENGSIYKADDGDVYSATLTQIDADTLRLRGYVGIPLFGKTQVWTRVNKNDYKACK